MIDKLEINLSNTIFLDHFQIKKDELNLTRKFKMKINKIKRIKMYFQLIFFKACVLSIYAFIFWISSLKK